MATYKADGLSNAELKRSTALEGLFAGRELKVQKASYTFVGTEAALEHVELFKLPAGCTIIPWLSSLQVTTDAATTLTIDIGDEDTLAPTPLVDSDADRYCDGVDCGAAGFDLFANGVAATSELYTLQSECYITMTFATLVTPVANGEIQVNIVYAVP
jgi:hypothetical protein